MAVRKPEPHVQWLLFPRCSHGRHGLWGCCQATEQRDTSDPCEFGRQLLALKAEEHGHSLAQLTQRESFAGPQHF